MLQENTVNEMNGRRLRIFVTIEPPGAWLKP